MFGAFLLKNLKERNKKCQRFQKGTKGLWKSFPMLQNHTKRWGMQYTKHGPLDDKTRALIKLAISTGARFEGAVHSHTRKAIKAGCTKEEIRHAVMLSLPTIGLPSMMAALSWADDILDDGND